MRRTRDAIRKELRDWMTHKLSRRVNSEIVEVDPQNLSDDEIDELLYVARGNETPYFWRPNNVVSSV